VKSLLHLIPFWCLQCCKGVAKSHSEGVAEGSFLLVDALLMQDKWVWNCDSYLLIMSLITRLPYVSDVR